LAEVAAFVDTHSPAMCMTVREGITRIKTLAALSAQGEPVVDDAKNIDALMAEVIFVDIQEWAEHPERKQALFDVANGIVVQLRGILGRADS